MESMAGRDRLRFGSDFVLTVENLQRKGMPVVQSRATRLPVLAGPSDERRLTVRLSQIYPALLDALQHQRAFLSDFDDETIEVSEDLYDVLLAYQHFQQG